MIGYICSAVTDFVVTFAEDSDIVNLHGWSQGSFSGMSWSNVKVATIVVGITLVFTFFLSKPIGAYQLGKASVTLRSGRYTKNWNARSIMNESKYITIIVIVVARSRMC